MMSNLYKTPRLYTNQPLEKQVTLEVTPEQLHYLRNVMRMECGDELRLFNGQDGEWLYEIKTLSKKEGILAPTKQLKPQPKAATGKRFSVNCLLVLLLISRRRAAAIWHGRDEGGKKLRNCLERGNYLS